MIRSGLGISETYDESDYLVSSFLQTSEHQKCICAVAQIHLYICSNDGGSISANAVNNPWIGIITKKVMGCVLHLFLQIAIQA